MNKEILEIIKPFSQNIHPDAVDRWLFPVTVTVKQMRLLNALIENLES